MRHIVSETKRSIVSNSLGRYLSAYLTARNSPFLLKDQLLPQLNEFGDVLFLITFCTKFRTNVILKWSFKI